MLQALIIAHPKHGSMTWYFECDVDDVDSSDTEFAKAKALAIGLGIYVSDATEEIITDFFEFENAMRNDGLLPQEDELTEDLRRLIALRARHDTLIEDANKNAYERGKLSTEINMITQKHYEALRGKIKVVDGISFNGQNGLIIGLQQA